MREVHGDLFAYADKAWIVITTNGIVRADGACVMGRGVAMQAARRWRSLPYRVGYYLKRYGNRVFAVEPWRVFTFPVKEHWRDKASEALIVRSAQQLREIVDKRDLHAVYLPRPGCGNGGLTWPLVRPLILPFFDDDRFVIVNRDYA